MSLTPNTTKPTAEETKSEPKAKSVDWAKLEPHSLLDKLPIELMPDEDIKH